MEEAHKIFKEEMKVLDNPWTVEAEYIASSIKKNYPNVNIADIISGDWREYVLSAHSGNSSIIYGNKAFYFRYWFGNFVSLMLQDYFPAYRDKNFRRDVLFNRSVLPFKNLTEENNFKDKLALIMNDSFAKIVLEIGSFQSGYKGEMLRKNKNKIETLIKNKSLDRIDLIWGTVMLLSIIHFEFIYGTMTARDATTKEEIKNVVASLMWLNSVIYWLLERRQKTSAQKKMAESKNATTEKVREIYNTLRKQNKFGRPSSEVEKLHLMKLIVEQYKKVTGKDLKRRFSWFDNMIF